MSHELRTPLNSILGFAGLLEKRLQGKLGTRDQRFLAHLSGSGRHLLRLIDDVLDLAKIDTGRMGMEGESFDVGEVLEGLVNVELGPADEKHIRLEFDRCGDLPVIHADPGRLKQVIYNLLSNAIKFSPEGKQVTLRVAPLEPTETPLYRKGVRIEVNDEGIGISTEDQEIIFEEFRQVDDGAGRHYEGAGLGLSLVRRLLEIQGGMIEVESELGQGSTFTVYFPSTPPEDCGAAG